MESLEYIKSRRDISKKELSNTRSELLQVALYLVNVALFIGAVYVLIAEQSVVYIELAKATVLVSLVLFVHLLAREGRLAKRSEA